MALAFLIYPLLQFLLSSLALWTAVLPKCRANEAIGPAAGVNGAESLHVLPREHLRVWEVPKITLRLKELGKAVILTVTIYYR